MKLLSSCIKTMLLVAGASTLGSTHYHCTLYKNPVLTLEETITSLQATICSIREQVAYNVQNNQYHDYPNKQAQELIARLGLREFNSSFNPFTHVGRYIDKNPSKKKQAQLRARLCQIIQEQELQPYKERLAAVEKELRAAVIEQELALLEQKNCAQLTSQDLKKLKLLKRLVDTHYCNELRHKIDKYDKQISRLRSEISSVRSAREFMLLTHHSACLFCMTCNKKAHTCLVCHACVDHCSCISYHLAHDVLTLLADVSMHLSLDTLRQQVTIIEAKRTKLQHKLDKLEKMAQYIWQEYLKNRLHSYQMRLADVQRYIAPALSAEAEKQVLRYQIEQLETKLGYSKAREYNGPNPALIGLGCALGIGVIAWCCSNA